MCGIAGIVGIGGIDQPEELGRAMAGAMAHRGPNAEGTWNDADVLLVHRRLSIIDLSKESDQPFHSEDGRYVVVYNGEIYNYRSLHDKLSTHQFRTASDTEVVLAAYERWGMDCPQHFEGMFAFAIWDRKERTCFIARDRLGIKPLYYHLAKDRAVFASELRTVLASDLVPRKIDTGALSDYLRFQTVHAPNTIIQNVKMLMPGHRALIQADTPDRFDAECWWNVVDSIDPLSKGHEKATIHKEIKERLYNAVEKRMMSDVPFGAFLSGGIDSSAIVGIMAEMSDSPVHTFSVGFDEEEFSEEKWALLVAKKFNTEHTPIRLTGKDLLDPMPEILAAMDHPTGDGPNTYVVSGATKKAGITMALSGLGGDEIFAGYPIFTRSMDLQKIKALAAAPYPLRRLGAAALTRLKFPKGYHKLAGVMQSGSVQVKDTYPLSRQLAHDGQLLKMLASAATGEHQVRDMASKLLASDNGGQLPLLSQVSVMELSTYLQNVLLRDTDQMSMAHALEVRVPFLDYKLVEYVLGVSDKMKYPHSPKELLTESLGDLVPREVSHRKKMGFTLPWAKWMRNELYDLCETRIKAFAERSALNRAEVLGLWQRFCDRDPHVIWVRIWYLVVLEDWLTRNEIE